MLVPTVNLYEIHISEQVEGDQHGTYQFISLTIFRRTLSL